MAAKRHNWFTHLLLKRWGNSTTILVFKSVRRDWNNIVYWMTTVVSAQCVTTGTHMSTLFAPKMKDDHGHKFWHKIIVYFSNSAISVQDSTVLHQVQETINLNHRQRGCWSGAGSCRQWCAAGGTVSPSWWPALADSTAVRWCAQCYCTSRACHSYRERSWELLSCNHSASRSSRWMHPSST